MSSSSSVRKLAIDVTLAGIDRALRAATALRTARAAAWWIVELFKSGLQDGPLPADNSCVGIGNSGY